MTSPQRKKVSANGGVERRIYKNPPIVEATCEILFVPVDDWNLAYSGLFLDKVKDRYSGRPREQRLLQLDSAKPIHGSPQVPAAAFREVTKVQIPNKDGTESVAVGPGLLSVHAMKPYQGWETYRTRIAEALAVFQSIAKPSGIRRIGMRYVNVIESSDTNPNPSDYLSTSPPELSGLDCKLASFILRHEYLYADKSTKLIVNTAAVTSTEGKNGIMLDLDVIREWSSDFPQVQQAMSFVDDLRRRERDAFEGHITSKSRELFDA